MAKIEAIEIKIGQVWTPNDPRFRDVCFTRYQVVAITPDRVIFDVITKPDGSPVARPRRVRILRDRVKPTSTGYRLVVEAP